MNNPLTDVFMLGFLQVVLVVGGICNIFGVLQPTHPSHPMPYGTKSR